MWFPYRSNPTPVHVENSQYFFFIAHAQVHDLEVRTQKCKDNVSEIQTIMSTWKALPLFERSDVKHDSLLKLDDREERCNKRSGPNAHAPAHLRS